MAAEHEGWYLKANVDISGLLQANKATTALFQNIRKVDAGLSGLHGNDALAKSIKSADLATASYIDRLKSEGKIYEANKAKVDLYSTQVDRLKSRQHGLASELDKIAEKSGKTSDAYNIQKTRINETAASINRLNSEINKLRPTGFDRLTAKVNHAEQASSKLKGTLKSGWDHIKGGAYSAATGVTALGAAALDGAKKSAELQQKYKEVTNLAVLGGEKQNEVTAAVRKMQASGRDMSIKYGKSQQEIAEGYEDLIKRGYTTKQALGALRTEVQASAASGDKFSDVTSVSSQVIEAFGMKANNTKDMINNTRKAVNMLAYSADATSTGFHSLGDSVHYFGAAAKAQHISLAESASVVGVLSNNGIEGSMGGTAMRDIINRIGNGVNSIGKKNSTFDQLGITAKDIEDSKGHIKSLADAMDVIWKHVQQHSKNSVQEQGFMKSIFGTTAQNAATILAENTKDLRQLTDQTQKMGDKGQYVAQLAAKNSATAKMQVARAKQDLNAFEMTLGAKLLPSINDAGEMLTKFLNSRDGKNFENNVADVVKNFAQTLIGLAKFATQHPTAMKIIGGGFLAGYATMKIGNTIQFLGQLKSNYEDLAEISPKLRTLGDATKQLTSRKISWKGMNKTAKLTVAASAVFNAVQIGNDFYQAATAKTAKQRIQSAGAGIGGIVGAGIGGALGGPAGATIGAQLGQAMGPKAATEFVKYFNPDTKYVERHRGKNGRTHKRVFTANTGRTKAEKSWGMNHTMDWQNFLHPTNAADFFGGAANITWNWLGHLNDQGFKNRSAKTLKASYKGSWEENLGKWLHKPMGEVSPSIRENAKQSQANRTAFGKWWNNLFGGNKVEAAELTKAQRKALRDGKTIGNSAKKGAKQGMQDFPSWTQKLGSKSNKWFKSKWSGMEKWAGGVNKKAQAGWKGFTTWSGNLGHKSNKWFKSKWSGMKGWAGGIQKNVQSGWKGFQNWFGDLAKGAIDLFKKPFEGLSNWVERHTPKPIRHAVGKIGQGINWAKNKLTGKAHATGGLMTTNHGALVGEAGPELAYKPYSNNVRLLGANGPQFTRVHAGEKILNAKDTRKVMSGGLGHGLILKGYASGNTKLNQTTKTVSKDYKSITSNATKQLTKLDRTSKSKWHGIASNSTKQSTKTRRSVVSDYTKMHKSVDKQMDNMHSGVVKTANATSKGFGKAMDKMTGYAKSTMGDTIGQLNKGIRGIDKVIGEFGGNASAIKPVHFATGSNGELPNNTLAMVNDAQTGPRQESIVRGNNLIIPSGKDRILPLQKGDKVLNGHQTQEMAHSMGLPHFAKGSGVGHGELKNLYNIAKRNWQNPEKTGKAMFSPVTGVHAGAKVLADAANKTGSDQGVKYWSALWSLAHKKVDDGNSSGPASGLLKAAEKYGEGHKYVWGAAGPTTFDCSGLVQYTLKHAYGISYPHYSGSQYGLTEHISKAHARMGDLVFWGSGGGEHVGIYAGGNKYFSAESPAQGIHMNTLSSVVGKGAPLFGRIKGANMQGSSKSKAVSVKTSDSLDRFVKNSVGSGFWATMQKIGDEFGEGGQYGNPSGDGVQRWRGLVRKALNTLHLSTSNAMVNRVLRQISTESSGNPKAMGGTDGLNDGHAEGLMQVKPPTFNAYKLKGHNSIWNGYDNMLAGLNYAKHRYGSSLSYLGNGHGYAKGGTHHGSGAFLVGEKGPEIMHVPGDVKIDDYQTSKRKIKDFDKEITPVKTGVPGSNQRPPINININFNGSVGNSKADEQRVAQIVQVKLVEALERYFGHEFGSDQSIS
ncbi:phage tail tape measure protein [Lactobacillus crispatus]|uniref:phage tail tape measure protein n=1 Tax=Lactobacillus crispatus TaxID=47770 RepID=UPI0010404071|nr:phage tail tape measure protein [Lactobacillus crispatus]